MDLSNVVFSQDIVMGHYIDEKTHGTSVIDMQILQDMFMPCPEFLFEYLALILFSVAFIVMLKFGFRKKVNIFNFFYGMLSEHPSDDSLRNFSLIGQLFACNLLFLFFVKEIMMNTVNTRKIVVDIENLLYSKEKIYETNKGGFSGTLAKVP